MARMQRSIDRRTQSRVGSGADPGATLTGRCACGTSPVGWFTVASASARLEGGSLRTHLSSPGVERQLCGDCGTPLTYRIERRPTEVDFTLGSLDEPDRVVPVDHIWMTDAPGWDRPADGLPQHAKQRPPS